MHTDLSIAGTQLVFRLRISLGAGFKRHGPTRPKWWPTVKCTACFVVSLRSFCSLPCWHPACTPGQASRQWPSTMWCRNRYLCRQMPAAKAPPATSRCSQTSSPTPLRPTVVLTAPRCATRRRPARLLAASRLRPYLSHPPLSCNRSRMACAGHHAWPCSAPSAAQRFSARETPAQTLGCGPSH